MSPRTSFHGLWIPLVTPFRDGQVDHPALKALVARLRADGVDGFVACGSTGEAAALDKEEQLAVLETVLAAAGALPVAMGVCGYHMPQMQDWVRTLTAWPLAGLLVPAPLYIRPGQAGLLPWFTGIADAAEAPVIVYDIPYRTGTTIARETLLALAGHPRIVAVKDCGGDPGKSLALIADGRMQVLAGEDLQLFSLLAQGAAGAITASAHVHTRRFVELVALLRAGKLEDARAIWLQLVPLVEALFAQPNPAPVKALLAHAGAMAPELRPPMVGVTKAFEAELLVLSARAAAR